jgi:hypothetical protein
MEVEVGLWDMCVVNRSPWSNAYYPALDDGFLPSAKLRALEVEANGMFDVYRQLYVHSNEQLHLNARLA